MLNKKTLFSPFIFGKLKKWDNSIQREVVIMRKIWSLIIATTLMFTVFGLLNIAKAETNFMDNKIPDNEIEFLTGSTLDGYNYIELSEPVTENYDGVYEVLIGYT